MDGQNETQPTEETKTAQPTLAEMRAELKFLNEKITGIDSEIKTKQDERAAARKQYRALIGKIETRVAAGEE